MSLEWKDGYKIGHDEIDAQHQQLFKLVNTVLAAKDKATLTACAMALFKYTREHFAHEEALMQRLDYPAMAAHKAQHESLISRLNEVSARIANGTLDHQVLEVFLTDWLLNHIANSDIKLATYIQATVE
ncbi:bacteriohemerythrin [Rhodoferax fermentans]|uniref:Hemerythrin-like domain-containing protein n=1 Tax=Rhodoferax fermentans TaxID=28066 RepID=A0A1T1AQ44_RHOFE|nr:bacteriohemerythrin [Rhodoferax fermentans]MBK1683476.1 hypothetical protein [Rhodoferax fermentans]OOV06230.1 hypothetical protein RF819_05375 [Rhodoferax fermentans]